MKLQELKHNHSLTDLLKIILFSILMLLPFLSVATRCLYVICNKNAYESYYGETINQSEEVQTNKLKMNYEYTFINTGMPTINTSRIGVEYIELLSAQYSFDQDTWSTVKFMGISLNSAQTAIYLRGYDESNTNITQYQLYNLSTDESYYLAFRFRSKTESEWANNTIYETRYNKFSYLDNVFEYSISQMAENPMFNWTQNTALYTGVKAMTDNLEIQTPVIAVLIVYWFILTIIYIIIDITLKLFTYLTHGIFHKS